MMLHELSDQDPNAHRNKAAKRGLDDDSIAAISGLYAGALQHVKLLDLIRLQYQKERGKGSAPYLGTRMGTKCTLKGSLKVVMYIYLIERPFVKSLGLIRL